MQRWQRTGALVGIVVGLFSSIAALAETVSWRRVGTQPDAKRIAACNDGKLYALHRDGRIFVNSSGGTDAGWRLVGASDGGHSIGCSLGKLVVFRTDRTLWRNVGTDSAVRWERIGRPFGAKEVAAGTMLAVLAPTAVYYALNDDNSLWVSGSGRDGSWQRVGLPGAAARIAVGGTLNEARVFALNTDKRLYLNLGRGCDAYWRFIDHPGAAAEIAAQHATRLFALNTDGSLWVGTVNRREARIQVSASDFEGLMTLVQFQQNRIRLHENAGSFTPSRMLASFGITPSEFGLPRWRLEGPLGVKLNVWLNDINSSRLGLEAGSRKLVLTAEFEENGPEIRVDSPAPNFDIRSFRATADLVTRFDGCMQTELVPENVQFFGELRADSPLGFAFDWLLSHVVNFRREVETILDARLKDLFARPTTQRGLRQALLTFAQFRTGETWQGIVGTSLQLGHDKLEFIVEK